MNRFIILSLNKIYLRCNKLMNYYPFNQNLIYNDISFNVNINEKEYDSITKFIRKKIVRNNKLIMIGFQAFNRFFTWHFENNNNGI